MPVSTHVRARWAPLAVSILVALAPCAAQALSKRDEAAAQALTQRMAAAEQRYRDAVVKTGNNDPTGVAESNAALEDMEDVVDACAKQKGCNIGQQIAAYKRLLKLNVDAEAAQADGADGDDPMDPDPDHAGDVGAAGPVPEAARAASLLDDKSHRFDQMVQYNPAVQAGIRRWLTDLRGPLMQSYENYAYMRQQMWPSYERAGLPEALLFGIMAKESNGKVHVTSRAGAAGPMQFMYATGRRFGLGPDGTGFDTRYDPAAAAEASASYLNERMAELNRSIEMALAAYNGGEGRALRVFQNSGGRGFWDSDVYNQFPVETRDYVPMVIAAAWLFLHPKKYGLHFPRLETKPATLRLSKPSSLYELTICLGNADTRDGFMRALRNLNPRYQLDSWLPAGSSLNATTQIVSLYNRYCVGGPRAELAHQLVTSDASNAIVTTGPLTSVATQVAAPALPTPVTASAPARPRTPREHRVARGDTLVSVAQKYGCDTKSLARSNGLKAPRYPIRPGQRLKLQGCGG